MVDDDATDHHGALQVFSWKFAHQLVLHVQIQKIQNGRISIVIVQCRWFVSTQWINMRMLPSSLQCVGQEKKRTFECQNFTDDFTCPLAFVRGMNKSRPIVHF